MPEVIIVASWRVMTARSSALTRLKKPSLICRDAVLVLDVEDDQPARLELVGDGLLVLGLDLAAGLGRPRGRSP